VDPSADSPQPPGGVPARALAIAAGLPPSRVQVVDSIGSTNLALMRADWGPVLDGPRVLLARQQTEGRGRRGRVWLSGGDESLTLSVCLELPLPEGGAQLTGLSVRAGVEVAECLAGLTGGLALKWPNDLQRHGRKVAGLLCESRLQADRVRVVAGLGINLLPAGHLLDQIGQPAGALFDTPADLPDRWRLAGLIAAALLQIAMPLPPLAGAGFVIAAMGGLFAASIRAPLVGVVLAAELTGGYALILPLIVTCVTANAVAQALGSRPLYELLLERTLRLAGKTPPAPATTGVPTPVGMDDKP